MSINYVSLTLDLYDGQGNPVVTGQVSLTPNVLVADSTDHIVVTQAPVTVKLFGNPLPTVQIAATDNTGLLPANWGWLVQAQFPGAPAGQVYEVLFANGATQYLSDLIPAVEGPLITSYATTAALAAKLALPSGTAAAGLLPVATGTGTATAWGTLPTTLDAIPHPVASVSFNGQKGISAAPGVSAADLATIGQLKLDFNVKSVTYGAKGDGTTVDTAAVQNTVAAALAAGGGDVLFPPGTYVISNVTFGSNLNICGSGEGDTVLLLDPAANGTVSTVVVCRVAPASSVTATSYCHVRDLTIDGSKATWGANTTNRLMGYYLGQSTNGLISHCGMTNVEIRNCLSYGADIERAQYTTLVNCEAHDNGYATGTGTHINADGFTLIGDDIQAIGCRAWNNAVEGFRGGQSGAAWHRVQLLSCHAWGNGSHGASLGSDTTSGDALWDSSITGGSFYGNGAAGIYLTANANGCTVTGATSQGNATNGILVSGALNCSITGNTLRDNATSGSSNPELYLTSSSTYITATGNTVRSANATHAISEQTGGGTDYNTFSGNTVASTSTTIVVNGTHSYVSVNQGYTGGDIGPGTGPSGTPTVSGIIVSPGGLTTTAATGFLWLPTCTGPPTGTPTTEGSAVPLVVNSATSQLFAYIGGAWKAITLS